MSTKIYAYNEIAGSCYCFATISLGSPHRCDTVSRPECCHVPASCNLPLIHFEHDTSPSISACSMHPDSLKPLSTMQSSGKPAFIFCFVTVYIYMRTDKITLARGSSANKHPRRPIPSNHPALNWCGPSLSFSAAPAAGPHQPVARAASAPPMLWAPPCTWRCQSGT